jgi:hypothetical protein
MKRLERVVGTEIVNDIRMGHSWYEFNVLFDFLSINMPTYFIEIGVHEGGLAYLLIPLFPSMRYSGIELYSQLVRPEVKKMFTKHGNTLWCVDCFAPKVFSDIKNLSTKIIYCDGGHKAHELQYFRSACRRGDVLMAHDYHDDVRVVRDVPREYFKPEVVPEDIANIDSDKTFERLPEELFKETRIVGWKKK